MKNKNIIKWYDYLWLWILPTIIIREWSSNDGTVTLHIKKFKGHTYILKMIRSKAGEAQVGHEKMVKKWSKK